MRTTLLVPVLEARALVSGSLLPEGQPPHITLMFPFVDVAALTIDVIDEVERRCSAFPAFDFVLRQVVPFGEVVFIAPDPAEPFRELLQALTKADPPPPYPVTVTDTIPHLTVAFSRDPAELERVSARVAANLPVSSRATEVWLMEESTAGWSLRQSFGLPGA